MLDLHWLLVSLLLIVALEEITDVVQKGLHVKRVEASPRPLDAVLWKAQTPARRAVGCARAVRSQARGAQPGRVVRPRPPLCCTPSLCTLTASL